MGVGERSGSGEESLTCRRKRLLHQLHPFVSCLNPSLELGIFSQCQHLFELWPGPISGLDQIPPGNEQLRTDLLFGQGLVFLLGEFVVVQIPEAGERVHAMQR